MILYTVFITYNRLELTKRAIASYLETVSVPYTFHVVDNGSTDGTPEWLENAGYRRCLEPTNRYPGWACNHGFWMAPRNATHLHRADNDFLFLPGWSDHVQEMFEAEPRLGQLGLRTDAEEQHCSINVGGNFVIRRELYDRGLRMDERPWSEYPPGYAECASYSPQVRKMGWKWRRVERKIIQNLATGDWSDPYYAESYGVRRIPLIDPALPGTT